MWNDKSIVTKEVLPILLAVAMWGLFWLGNRVLVHCDNMAVMNIMSSNTSKDKTIIHLLRGYTLSVHTTISTYELHTFRGLKLYLQMPYLKQSAGILMENPKANKEPTPIPELLSTVLVSIQPDWLSKTWRESLAISLSIASQTARVGAMQQVISLSS